MSDGQYQLVLICAVTFVAVILFRVVVDLIRK